MIKTKAAGKLRGDRKLMVLGRTWTVSFGPTDKTLIVNDNGVSIDGQCDPDSFTIAISGQLSRQGQRQTLLHEICHAVFALMGGATLTDEEHYTRAIETGLYETLRNPDNDWFRKFLLEKD